MDSLKEFFGDVFPLHNLKILDSSNASNLASIILSLDVDSFNIFWETNTISDISNKYLKGELNYKLIEQMQYGILLDLQKDSIDIKLIEEVINNLLTLKNNNLLSNKRHDTLIRLLEKIKLHKLQQTQDIKESTIKFVNFFDESLELIKEQIDTIQNKCEVNDITKNDFIEIINKAKNQHFKIGIAGILSAGKSTLINALLKEEVLGSSTIPETASLTILKYSDNKKAEITFWNTQEFKELQKTISNETLELLDTESFKEKIQSYIQDTTKTIEVKIDELKNYTSANTSDKLCNLVKQTTLYTPLEILKNNVELIDTPGLDDPIIQREIITKEYIKQCDLLLYAMNASQSATQFDIDFIIYVLENTNISRILIILTHSDLLEKRELDLAFAYTKSSIQKQLLDKIPHTKAMLMIERLDFIYLASYPALLCNTNPKKAQEKGYTLKDSNLQALEDYLNSTLLGSNSTKAKDIIFIALRQFEKILLKLQENLNLESKLLFASESKIQEEIEIIKSQATQKTEEINALQLKLKNAKEELETFLQSAKNSLNQKLKNAKTILTKRIYDDILYDMEKNQTIQNNRLDRILELGLSDFLIDILRDSKKELSKKIDQIKLSFSEIAINESSNINLDKNLITKCKIQLLNEIQKITKKHNKNSKDSMFIELGRCFDSGFLSFEDEIIKQSKNFESKITQDFTQALENIINTHKKDEEEKQRTLQKIIQNSHNNNQEKEQRMIKIDSSQKCIKDALKLCTTLQQYTTKE